MLTAISRHENGKLSSVKLDPQTPQDHVVLEDLVRRFDPNYKPPAPPKPVAPPVPPPAPPAAPPAAPEPPKV